MVARKGRQVVALVLGVIGALLAYGVAIESLAALLSPRRPVIAASLMPRDGDALAARATNSVAEALTDSDIKTAITDSEAALRAAPLSASALRDLAQARQLAGNEALASAVMKRAGERNLRDTTIQLWLFREDVEAKRFNEAFTRADLMMRRRFDLEPLLFPQIVAQLDQPAAYQALISRLRLGPDWRADLLQTLARSDSFAARSTELLTNLSSSPKPPSEKEVAAVAAGLAQNQRWTEVRALWSRFGGAQGALLYNGDFEHPPRDPPFGWDLSRENGTVAAIERVEGGAGHDLFVQFLSGHASPLAGTLLVLGPGRYRLQGRVSINLQPAGTLYRWSVACSGSESSLGKLQLSGARGWRTFAGDFEVPAEGCPAQWLRLMGDGGEGYLPANALFDDLSIKPLATAG